MDGENDKLDHDRVFKPTVSGLRGTSGSYNRVSYAVAASLTTTESQSMVDVKGWFDEHKLIALSLVAIIAILVIIMVICCFRHCHKKNNKQVKGNNPKATSVEHRYFEIPRWDKSPVQPKPTIQRQQKIEELGDLEFSLQYDYKRSQLNVSVIRGENFPLISSSNVSFTYVVVELRPFSQKYEAKAQTHYVRNSVSPLFNDSINYQVQAEDLDNQTLCLSVYDINHLSAHDLIGCVKLEFVGQKIESGLKRFFREGLKWEEGAELSRQIGEILVGLHWKRENEILELTIQEASNLRIMDTNKQTSNPYVKIQIYVNSFMILKKRTKVERKNISPKFKKKFDLNIPCECLSQNTQIVLTIKHMAKFRKRQVIGQLYLSGSEGKETVAEHWRVMKKGRYVEMWHELDLSIDNSLLKSDSKIQYLLFDDHSEGETSVESSDGRSAFGGSFGGSFDGLFENERSL